MKKKVGEKEKVGEKDEADEDERAGKRMRMSARESEALSPMSGVAPQNTDGCIAMVDVNPTDSSGSETDDDDSSVPKASLLSASAVAEKSGSASGSAAASSSVPKASLLSASAVAEKSGSDSESERKSPRTSQFERHLKRQSAKHPISYQPRGAPQYDLHGNFENFHAHINSGNWGTPYSWTQQYRQQWYSQPHGAQWLRQPGPQQEWPQAAVAASEEAPNNSPQAAVAASEEAASEEAASKHTGQVSGLYVYVGAEANIDEVASDIRNAGPNILIVCCSDETAAAEMERALEQTAVDTRGDGEGRPGVDDLQYKFYCVIHKELIIAGRRPMVKEVGMLQGRDGDGGSTLIAQIGFHSPVQGSLNLRVAAFSATRERGSSGWDAITTALNDKSVRLIAGEFSDSIDGMLASVRKRMALRVCAMTTIHENDVFASSIPAVAGSTPAVAGSFSVSAILVAGPVDNLVYLDSQRQGEAKIRGEGEEVNVAAFNIEAYNKEPYIGRTDEDETRSWPPFDKVKMKEMMVKLPRSRKLFVFMGANSSNRSITKKHSRYNAAVERGIKMRAFVGRSQ